jgi:predicted permease
METLWQDIRYGIRTLRQNLAVTAIAVLTLALGIGANTAIFSMVNSILLKPLPVRDAGRLVVLGERQSKGSLQPQFSLPEYRDVRGQTRGVFSDLAALQIGVDGLSAGGRADRVLTNYVSGSFFSMMGIRPALGRFILPSEGETPGADPVVVLSYAYWQARFAGDRGIVGRKVSIDGQPATIVGVAPEGFFGTSPLISVQAYLPVGMLTIEGMPADLLNNRANRSVQVYGRLADGASLASAQPVLAAVAQRLAREYPETNKDLTMQAFPEVRGRVNLDSNNFIQVIADIFLGLAVMVLLLACVNVANILLVRATVREREAAIRSALGAARIRLIRQLLTESILLALAGGVAGILVGVWLSSGLGSMQLGTDLPARLDFSFDWRVFSYAFACALGTGIAAGIVPAVRASRGNLSNILHQGGRGVVGGRHRLRSVLVTAQVGGSLMLLIVAGLFARSLGAAQHTDLGFDPNRVLNLTLDPNEIGYSPAQGQAFYRELLRRVRALPGVLSASTTNSVPMGYYFNADAPQVEGYQPPPGQPAPLALINAVSTDYLRTMRITLLRGRDFTAADDDKAPHVAIINQTMARRFWPKQDAIGRQFRMAAEPGHPLVVVGVVRDFHFQGITTAVQPYIFMPLPQHYGSSALAFSLQTLQVRTVADPRNMIRSVENTVAALAPGLPVFDVKTMREALNTLNGLLVFQVAAGLAAALGTMGLVLAIVGVYGVVSYDASRKTHEIGIRMALGAQRATVLQMVFRQGVVIVCIGLGLGLAAAFMAARVVGSFLAVSALDPVTYIASSLTLAAVALLASYIPARRAMAVDPMVALRHE